MTEDDARDWVISRHGKDAAAKLDKFAGCLIAANDRQNLVAPSTIPTIWTRHLLDSAQLLDLTRPSWRHWVDVGSGAGLPGLVIAILTPDQHVTLIEPRRLRVEFLHSACDAIGVTNVAIVQAKAQNAEIAEPADIVSARAVATLDILFAASAHFTTRETTFILPKGEGANSDVAVARRSWQGAFHVKQSILDPKSGIVVATGVAPR